MTSAQHGLIVLFYGVGTCRSKYLEI